MLAKVAKVEGGRKVKIGEREGSLKE